MAAIAEVVRHRSAGAREVDGLDAVAALRHARRVARLSQRDLARRAGVSQSLIARIEARRVDPPVGQMQRLLGLCGLRWELRLVGAGVTPGAVAARSVVVRERALRRREATAWRRTGEHAAARARAAELAGAALTVRERRGLIREARLAERAAQWAALAALVADDDEEARGWVAADAHASALRWRSCAEQVGVPLAWRLPPLAGDHAAGDLRRLLDDLAGRWVCPPVALSGALARAVWSPARAALPQPIVEMAALRGRAAVEEFLRDVGAQRRGGSALFDVGSLAIRLRPPRSASLVRWRPGRPPAAIAVVRPESRPGAAGDRHAVRAALESAGRDRGGRRRPPYHETWDGTVRPRFVEPDPRIDGCAASARAVA